MSNFPLIRELARMQRNMDKIFEDVSLPRGTSSLMLNPSCEIKENKAEYLVRFDLPGIPKDQIKIDLHENLLTVSGERKEEKRDEKNHYSEISYGSFSRSFTLPTAVDAEKVSASYDNGVLNITIAKADASKTRQIAVK